MDTNEANRILKKHGAVELSKTAEGRGILAKAAEKYRIDLLQPGHPDFMKYHGAKVIAAKRAQERNEQRSRDMWGQASERRAFEAQKRAGSSTDWKSKQL